jgi:hypothetical protein
MLTARVHHRDSDQRNLGANRLRSVTAQIAHRGADVSRAGQTVDQHLAIVLVDSRVG